MSSMLKILFISPQPYFEWRGSPIRVSFNVKALAELGYEVDLLTFPVGKKKKVPGVRIIRVPNLFGIKKIPIGPSLPKVLFDLLLFIYGMKLVLIQDYAIIHGVEEAGTIAVILSKLKKYKVIFEKHSDPFSHKSGVLSLLVLSIYSKIEKFTVNLASAVIATGPGLAEQVERMGSNTPVFDIFDIPSSLVEPSTDISKEISKKLKQSNDELLVTFVGSFAVYQGINLMLAAIPLVIKADPKARFIIIGGNREEILAKKSELGKEGFNRSVTFLGKVSPELLPNYLAASDILIAPRLAGVNTPLKLLDYLKAGRAIVATDVNANTLILDRTIAILTKPDPSAFAEGIITLMNEDDLRKKLGRNGKKKYLDQYNYNNFKQKLSECYRSII